ncbi:hypothetical protein Bpfe_001147 [Biomphalaria pfeifferi]|uniref:Uncharacterized protein n=1 Tax=Biomphalaria pfeifferi TaxID=112525 RepID=A0AAD8CBL6_BIOPF|nr:hypothetical protein Bpfe_001147 [Biomphalaria pfeifferi]
MDVVLAPVSNGRCAGACFKRTLCWRLFQTDVLLAPVSNGRCAGACFKRTLCWRLFQMDDVCVDSGDPPADVGTMS